MSAPRGTNRRRDPSGTATETWLLGGTITVTMTVIAATWVGVHGGYALSGRRLPKRVPTDPFALTIGVFTGQTRWPSHGWYALAAFLAALAAFVAALVWLYRRATGVSSGGSRVDPAARVMGRGTEVSTLTPAAAAATATRLGLDPKAAPGVLIGRTVAGGKPVYGSWEDMHIDVWGPRTGKTTSRAIPAIMDAPGSVLVTSNKRDVVDATRDPRAAKGQVWVFDPQGIAGEEPTWWWDPLSYVTDEVRAAKLAEHFAVGSRDPGARTDAYFTPAGQDLLAGLLLAAALDWRPITDVYHWLTRPTDPTAVTILSRAGYRLIADQVRGVIRAPDKQRGGIYGTAMQMASALTNPAILPWITPGRGDRPHFGPEQFSAQPEATLYLLSREGRANAGPLVTALTVAVVEAAEELAAGSPGGRLPTPLLGVLDEAANVCRWKDLPDLYSHYGSRGIVLMTILQSWSQGTEVWGEAGMRKLWSAANVRVYGGGVAEAGFLKELSDLIGDYDRVAVTTSHGRGGHHNASHALQRQPIMTPADLTALPRGRAVVFTSGNRPTLIRTLPWMTGPHAKQIRASLTAHNPGTPTTTGATR